MGGDDELRVQWKQMWEDCPPEYRHELVQAIKTSPMEISLSDFPDLEAQICQDLKILVAQSLKNGWSYDKLAKLIQEKYPQFKSEKRRLGFDGKPLPKHIRSKAYLIAITEQGNFYERKSYDDARRLQEGGLTMEKCWATAGDTRVSKECRANEAEGWIPFNQSHVSGHQHPFRCPGCRCTEQYRRAQKIEPNV